MASSSMWPIKNIDELRECFWKTDSNREAIIRGLNKAPKGEKMRVRLELFGPYIYGIIVNKPQVVIHTKDIGEKRMKLMKIGFTHADTEKSNDDNRIATVKKKTENKLKSKWQLKSDEVDVSVIFVLPIDALDTRGFFDIEAEVRKKCGIPLPKTIGKKLDLPVHTEWVVTTDIFVKQVRKKIDDLKGATEQVTPPRSADQKHIPAAEGVEPHTLVAGATGSINQKSKQTPKIQQSSGAKAATPKTDGLENSFGTMKLTDMRDAKSVTETRGREMCHTESVFRELEFNKEEPDAVAVIEFLEKTDDIAIDILSNEAGKRNFHLK